MPCMNQLIQVGKLKIYAIATTRVTYIHLKDFGWKWKIKMNEDVFCEILVGWGAPKFSGGTIIYTRHFSNLLTL